MCDGSYDNGYGSTSWCLDEDGSVARGVNIFPIASGTIDATRCELAGIYNILLIVECMVQFFWNPTSVH